MTLFLFSRKKDIFYATLCSAIGNDKAILTKKTKNRTQTKATKNWTQTIATKSNHSRSYDNFSRFLCVSTVCSVG